ncbi:potassium channel family protein [Pseudohongiella spirulinae]|uniref:Potassium voltage-gated channel subfamily KQT possible potassium channel, VIC family n=1 Tax=Pseudohongiella spirulinae TaxID=1249552 RepID=A0A0S2KG92_9GAMM|nr:potassium channel family protein [Pseudohongiella spirulinae]ALO47350.1 Potassium voltage-gated channel subfamily KQT possible potassium channel, VIC family [Pseudohongiella spirulinae]
MSTAPPNSIRSILHRHLTPEAWPEQGMSPTNIVVSILILIGAMSAVLDTEPTLTERFSGIFFVIELVLFVCFFTEYLARVYAAGEEERYQGLLGRLRYCVSFWAIIDLLALLPFLLTIGASNAFMLRFFRLLRLLRLARLGRFSEAINAVLAAVRERRYELMLSLGAAGMLLVGSASLLYLVEADNQPEAFGSIPRALWWSIATLTTVGYGDVTPVTALGKFFAGITAIAGIGLIAMPTGVLAAAFSDAFQRRKEELDELQNLED